MLEFRRICCPIDFSEASREALHAAVELARRFDAELLLLHVYQMPGVVFPEASLFSGQAALEQVVAVVERALEEWKHEAMDRGARRVEAFAQLGVPFAEVVRFATEHQCDLVVMGTHGRTAIMRALLGSVAEKVVRHAPCPVLTIRPKLGAEAASLSHPEQPAH